MPRTLAEKVWEHHVVHRADGEPDLLYVDLHLVHEVTSPQAFDGLRLDGARGASSRPHGRDHGSQRADHPGPVTDEMSARQMQALQPNADEFGITLYPWGSGGQGIVHVIGPEMGYTQPGMTIVCGDSHTSTHGAFGALAFGIGTSEVEHVLATQTLPQSKPKSMAVTVDGDLPANCSAKDIILAIINTIGTGGGVGHVIEYRGAAIGALSMEGRMTICNMSIEGGARAGMVAPDDTTFAYVKGRPHAPADADWDARSSTGAPCRPTRARTSTARSRWTPPRCSPTSAGARTPRSPRRSTARCPIPRPSTRRSARPPSAR